MKCPVRDNKLYLQFFNQIHHGHLGRINCLSSYARAEQSQQSTALCACFRRKPFPAAPLLHPFQQLHNIRRVNAEETVKEFGQFRSIRHTPQAILLFKIN